MVKDKRLFVEQVPSIRLSAIRSSLPTGAEFFSLRIDGQLTHLTLAWRPRPPFGGMRAYLVCPHCERATEALFLMSFLACRACHNLGYRSEALTPRWRAWHRLLKLQSRAGADVTRLPPRIPARPKGRHRRTWQELHDEIRAADEAYAASFARSRLGR